MLMTECSKCGAEMPPLARAAKATGIFDRILMEITGYRCGECGHWNNLKTRKWWKESHSKISPAKRK